MLRACNIALGSDCTLCDDIFSTTTKFYYYDYDFIVLLGNNITVQLFDCVLRCREANTQYTIEICLWPLEQKEKKKLKGVFFYKGELDRKKTIQ